MTDNPRLNQQLAFAGARKTLGTQPSRAQAGDELKRQAGVPGVITDPNAPDFDRQVADLDRQIGGTSFTQGLSERRRLLSEASGRTASLEEFQAGEGAEVRQELAGRERVAGESPVGIIERAMGVEGRGKDILSETARQEVSALNALSSFLLGVSGELTKRDQLRLQQQDQVLKESELGLRYNEETGSYDIDLGTGDADVTAEQQADARLRGERAVARVNEQGGQDILKGVKTKAERIAVSEAILQAGGVTEYRRQLPLAALVDDKETAELQNQTGLMQEIVAAQAAFEKFRGAGTGPLAQFIPGFVRSPEGRDIIAKAEKIKTTYAAAVSGKTVSDKEIQRLEKFLPTTAKTEQQNLEDLNRLATGLQINQRIFELGKQHGLTPNQAFARFGQEVFEEFGEPFPGGDGETGEKTIRVKQKSSGKAGSIPESEFDPDVYERI